MPSRIIGRGPIFKLPGREVRALSARTARSEWAWVRDGRGNVNRGRLMWERNLGLLYLDVMNGDFESARSFHVTSAINTESTIGSPDITGLLT
jgi:hypothetical protein